MRSETYDSKFYAWHRDRAKSSAEVVVPLLIELVEPRSVVDIGCGTGVWLAEFDAHGVEDILGIDGTHLDRSSLDIPNERFLPRDLSRSLDLDRRFELVLSLEVAEHLPASRAGDFIDTLTALGDVVVFSAAVPHQGGDGHVNEQWPAWWAERFRDRGFDPIDCLRPILWRDERVAWWYAQNTIVYASPGALSRAPRLRDAHTRHGVDIPLALVHPVRYLEWIEWSIEELYGK